MNLLHIWITLPSGETVELGELAFDDGYRNITTTVAFRDAQQVGNASTAFRYSSSWLSRRDAFPITPDPQVLPLRTEEFPASNLGPPLQVFNDALPDDWGRRLIIAEKRLPRHQQGPYWIMRHIGGNGLGALSFSETNAPPGRSRPPYDLAEVAAAAEAFDAGLPVEDAALTRLCAAGGSPGGARPKVLATNEGYEWIAKLPSQALDRGFDVVGLEATCLALGRRAGLDVPDFRLEQLGKRRAVLVRRFDITPAGGRAHMISLSTLCRETPGRYTMSYNEPANAIRKFSDDPADMERFFRQMVFNAAIGNTDDHLKNFLLIRTERGYRLSPAFDLVPDIGQNREHVMAIGYQFGTPTGDELTAVGKHWLSGDDARARRIVDEVVEAVSAFNAIADQFEVASNSITTFGKDVAYRLDIIRHQ